MSQARFGKVDEFGWWYSEIILADVGMHFTSTDFQDKYQTHSVRITLAAPEHQEINRQVEVTQRKLCRISH